MSGHTPGPWVFDGLVQIVEEARPHMRVCFLPSDHDEYASSKPNGRLIAAAPDLLEALEKARNAINLYGLDDFEATTNELLALIDAALTKAKEQT